MPSGQLTAVAQYVHRVATPAATVSDSELVARFAAGRDEVAFTALVRRHGPMVLGVCRRVLGDWHAAEDAFQAVVLVLARRAGELRQSQTLAPWLYSVAHRTALKARTAGVRRRAREGGDFVDVLSADTTEAVAWQDLRPVLDHEVQRLPPRYRLPFVLSYLEGQTNAEIARLLGCSRGTVATRLARARERLRRRLAGRGLAPFALPASPLPAEAVTDALQRTTVRAVTAFAAGQLQAAGTIAPGAVPLAKGVMQAMLMTRLKVVVLLLGLTVAGGLSAVGSYCAGAGEPGAVSSRGTPGDPPAAADEAVAPGLTSEETVSYRTTNFAVTAPTQQLAVDVCRAAERQRKALALLWLGNELPAWPRPCPVRVRITEGPSASATSFSYADGKVTSQRMELVGSLDAILADLLPHEVTHTVLAHWAGGPLPRWADEGAATLSESAIARSRHEATLRKLVDKGGILSLERLLPLYEYPQEVRTFYAEAYDLTDFLVQSAGRATFLGFVALGERRGWDEAVRSKYPYRTVEGLQRAWLARLLAARPAEAPSPAPSESRGKDRPFGDRDRVSDDSVRFILPHPDPRASRPHGKLPAGPGPTQALVSRDQDGAFRLWRMATVYEPRSRVDSRGEPTTSYHQVAAMTQQRYEPDEVQCYDMNGKQVAAADLPKLLKRETLCLTAPAGWPVDPLQLRLYKEGTLLVVVPVPTPPAPVPPSAPAWPAAPIPQDP
jgi:RNA polymerase sigma factor (sigma-70 family)